MAAPELKPLHPKPKSTLPMVAVVVLVALGLGVVFILPKTIQPNATSSTTANTNTDAVTTAPAPADSPLAEAEQRQARSAAQTLLNDALPLREELLSQGVEQWAAAEFATALASITTGEALYARGSYQEALSAYDSALTGLQTLRDGIPDRLQTALADAEAALLALDATPAITNFELALVFAADNTQAQQGLSRAEALATTKPLWQQAQIDIDNQQWPAAEQSLQQLLAADPRFPGAEQQLDEVTAQLEAASYTANMSRGYEALAAQQFTRAIAAFKAALTLEPNDSDALAALTQTRTEQTAAAIAGDLAQAKRFERNEAWAEAVAVYDKLLHQHPDLADVKAARLPAQIRAGLDQQFADIMADPLKLSSNKRYRSAQRTLADMRSLNNPGTKLSHQIQQLNTTLTRARTPVAIQLQSDNLTQVEVYRVAQLGTLSQHTLQLTPGHYVAAGNRLGFRDVRVEFTIDGLTPPTPINIMCTEPI